VLPTRQHLFGFVYGSRTSDLWLGLLVLFDYDGKLKITMKISNLIVGLAEYFAISMEGVNVIIINPR
jgi:hypothetical protein